MEMLADISSVNSKKRQNISFMGSIQRAIVAGACDWRASDRLRKPKNWDLPIRASFNTILGVDLPRITHHIEVQQKNNKLGKSNNYFMQISFKSET